MNRPRSQAKAFIALAMGAFGIALTEFVIMGILPKVAGGLSVSIPEAGHFIAAYALGVVIGAPILAKAGSRFPPHKALIALMIWFTVFNTLCAYSTSYGAMLLLRFLSGLPHGAYFGIGAVMATRLSREGKEAQGIARMFAGFTIANVIGVPLGTYIGNSMHWSASFLLVGLVGALTVSALFFWMPRIAAERQKPEVPPPSLFRNGELWALLALTAIGAGGFFAWFSYIAPLLIDISGISEIAVSYAMVLAGVGMVAGNFIGAKMTERLGAIRAIVWGMGGMSALLVLNSYVVDDPALALAMCFVIGLVTFTMAAPIQMAIIDSAPGSEMLAASFNQSAFNIANASGAFFAGLPMAFGYSVVWAGRVGAALAAIGAAIALAIRIHQKWRRKMRHSQSN